MVSTSRARRRAPLSGSVAAAAAVASFVALTSLLPTAAHARQGRTGQVNIPDQAAFRRSDKPTPVLRFRAQDLAADRVTLDRLFDEGMASLKLLEAKQPAERFSATPPSLDQLVIDPDRIVGEIGNDVVLNPPPPEAKPLSVVLNGQNLSTPDAYLKPLNGLKVGQFLRFNQTRPAFVAGVSNPQEIYFNPDAGVYLGVQMKAGKRYAVQIGMTRIGGSAYNELVVCSYLVVNKPIKKGMFLSFPHSGYPQLQRQWVIDAPADGWYGQWIAWAGKGMWQLHWVAVHEIQK